MSANEESWVDCAAESLLIDERVRAGLAVLWRAYICAQDAGANVWDLSMPAARLYAAGMTSNDLRWMLAEDFAEHRQETTGYGDAHRSFRSGNGYFLNNRSCLILTPSGAALAEHVLRETDQLPQATFSALKPRWDPNRRELSLGGMIVKRFRVPARNQETILSVFEEEGWVEHIQDPLPATPNIDAPTRLHDAINRLNRCQINSLLRFHGDGKGTGIFWDLASSQR